MIENGHTHRRLCLGLPQHDRRPAAWAAGDPSAVRAHEQVHVRQYERWGPLFVPAYLLSSLVELLRGRRPYRDNWFEREAYGKTAHDLHGRPR
jgi:hypothetical protein